MTTSMVTNHKAIGHAIQPVDFSELGLCAVMKEVAYLSCRVIIRQPVQTIQLSARTRNTLTWKITAFAIPNENDEAERSGPHACSDDQVLMLLDNNNSSSDLDGEAVASISESGAGIFQGVEHFVNQASLQDKLKAVHLHVLASEKWNDSRLKSCHKYVRKVDKLKAVHLYLPFINTVVWY